MRLAVPRKWILLVVSGPLLAGLWALSQWNYLLFHGILEALGVGIALAVFMLAWSTRLVMETGALLVIGVAYLLVAGVDLFHMLAYEGMGVFPGAGSSPASQLWLIGRFLEAGGLLAATAVLGRMILRPGRILALGVLLAGSLAAVYLLSVFPITHREGVGVTGFGLFLWLGIGLMLIIALVQLHRKRDLLNRDVAWILSAAMVLALVSVSTVTLTFGSQGALASLGHVLKVAAVILVYTALIASGLDEPYQELFADLIHSQDALKAERDFSRAVLETVGALVVVLDRQGRIVRFNRACENISGYSAKEVQGKSIWEVLLAPEESSGVREVFDRLLAGLEIQEYENFWVHRDGSLRRIRWSNTFLAGKNGSVEYVVGTGIDITESRRAEEALRKSEEQYRFLVHHLNEGIWAVDHNGATTFVNPHLAEMLGYDGEQMIGKSMQDFLCPKSREPFGQYLAGCRGGTCGKTDLRFRRKDGRVFYASLEARPVFDREGNYAGAVAGLMDTSEHQLKQEALRRTHDQLEARIRERTAELSDTIEMLKREAGQRKLAEENFRMVNEALQVRAVQLRQLALDLTQAEERERRRMAQAIHDHLQQMLVGVRMRLEALERNPDSDKQSHFLRQADELLKESIVFTRSLTVELSPPVLYEMGLASAIRWLGKQMKAKHNLEVLLDSDEDYQDIDDELLGMLFQSVRELLFNIVKHAGVTQATVSLRRREERIRIEVADQGVGFDPLRTVHQDEENRFGLFSIRERIVLLGGKLEIDSAPGRGARMILVCPLHRADAPESDPGEVVLLDRPAARNVSGLAEETGAPRDLIRVLVVDDHQVVREGLVTRLQQEQDIRVVGQAADGSEALELARKTRPDVVIMDYNMQPMNGVEAIRMARAELPQVQVIGLSAHEEEQVSASMLAAGACCHFTKGGSSQSLIAAIRACRESCRHDTQPDPAVLEAIPRRTT